MVEPPKPRTFAVHDKVTIIVSETSKQSSDQTLDTKKDYTFKGGLNRFPNLQNLLDAQFTSDSGSPITGVDVNRNSKFTGQGKLSRNDTFTDKITATVIDVKPNGNLVIKARQSVKIDTDDQYVVLTGECNKTDIGPNKTITSDKIFDLNVRTSNDGDVRPPPKAGWMKGGWDRVKPF